MTTICPKCNYVRQQTDEAPDWQCPACGVAYVKAGDAARSAMQSWAGTTRYDAAIETQDNGFPWFKLILFIALLYGAWAGVNMDRNKGAENTDFIRDTTAGGLQALAATVKPGDVVIYTTTSCPYCAQAKGWLGQNGFAFTECDTEADAACASAFQSLGGVGVPYLVVRGKHMKDGFDSEQFISLLGK
ncbi:MAG: glutaredoxin domain-containing protein [Sulfurimicrobium sp.]|jgi:glutaredoxin|nr:glutaredoxin domain-containing protein [Sulfurimicrobium sp.]